MFTGIVETTAQIQENAGGRLMVERPSLFGDIAIGSSIAVSGICLSVVELSEESMVFDVVQETYERTNITSRKTGRINLERALKADARFEGHIVQGHIDGIATVLNADTEVLTIELPKECIPFVVQKGSITIDGVSLTVASLAKNICTVALIPHTLQHTTLGSLLKGDTVNIETDILGKYVLAAESS